MSQKGQCKETNGDISIMFSTFCEDVCHGLGWYIPMYIIKNGKKQVKHLALMTCWMWQLQTYWAKFSEALQHIYFDVSFFIISLDQMFSNHWISRVCASLYDQTQWRYSKCNTGRWFLISVDHQFTDAPYAAFIHMEKKNLKITITSSRNSVRRDQLKENLETNVSFESTYAIQRSGACCFFLAS